MFLDLNISLIQNFLQGSMDPGLLGLRGDQQLEPIQRIDLGYAATNGDSVINLFAIAGDLLGTVSLTGTTVLDLQAITDPYSRAQVFARIKLIAVFNFATTDGTLLYWGPDATSGFDALVGGVADGKRPVSNGIVDARGKVVPGIDAWITPGTSGLAVNPTHKRLLFDAGAATIPYAVLIAGTDA